MHLWAYDHNFNFAIWLVLLALRVLFWYFLYILKIIGFGFDLRCHCYGVAPFTFAFEECYCTMNKKSMNASSCKWFNSYDNIGIHCSNKLHKTFTADAKSYVWLLYKLKQTFLKLKSLASIMCDQNVSVISFRWCNSPTIEWNNCWTCSIIIIIIVEAPMILSMQKIHIVITAKFWVFHDILDIFVTSFFYAYIVDFNGINHKMCRTFCTVWNVLVEWKWYFM